MTPELEAAIQEVLRTAEEVLGETELARLTDALASQGITIEIEGTKYVDREDEVGGADVIPSYRHRDKRLNIPTDQHAMLVDTTGDGDTDIALYRRDPALDPQLVWRGKEEADSEDLAVPVVPIYIQEKVDPRVVVENLRRTADAPSGEPELRLFDDFDGIDDPIESIEYYKHPANWSNRFILGDALVAMTSLAEKENLKGTVQTIYLDPPYGIKFQSNWQVSTRERSVTDGRDATRQPEQVKAFRDTWKHGIHSYLNYMRDRIQAARGLLARAGSIFVQISDDHVHAMRNLLDEVFGPDNFVSLITFQKTTSATAGTLPAVSDYLLWYAVDKREMKYRQLYRRKELGGEGASGYTRALMPDGSTISLSHAQRAGVENVPDGARPYYTDNLLSGRPAREGDLLSYDFEGRTYKPGGGTFKTNRQGMDKLAAAHRLYGTETRLYYIRYLDDFGAFPINNLWTDAIASFMDKIFVVQTVPDIVERCLLMTTDPGDLVLDPTCGSGTTAYAAEKWGRRWITIDTSRVALALARQRILGASYPYYLLVDSHEGSAAAAEIMGQQPPEPSQEMSNDLRRGFVYNRAQHVMLSSIANNPDIEPGMTRSEADAAINRHAEYETLFDAPVKDTRKRRVSGPFTFESLSPHRTVAPGDLDFQSASEASAFADARETGFVAMVLDNLEKAGVQNGYRDERLNLDWIEPYAGQWIQGVGSFTDADDHERHVAIAIGPETGTVGRELVANIAKEAATDVRADLVLVCAYAFDAGASEEADAVEPSGEGFAVTERERKLGRVKVLTVRINADLMMNEELKSTATGNLFMVFGEPDVSISEEDDGTISVELVGLDIYDPNKGAIRSAEPDDIACWFVDTNYNGDAFFVRHAYFTGGGSWDPYKSLKRGLKSEINEEAWAQLHRTESVPFPRPETGKIAVKAINHFGDEAMRVFEIS